MAETQTVINQQAPWSGQSPYLTNLFSSAKSTYQNQPTTYFPGQTYLELNDLQRQGLNSQLAYGTGQAQNQALGAQNALQSAYNAPDVANNPYIGGVADVMETRLNRNLQENLLPGIQGNFNQAGLYGGARQDLMRSTGVRDTQEALSQGLAGLYGDAYGKGLEQQRGGLMLAPQVQNMGFVPSQTTMDVGDKFQQESYLPLQEDIARWNFEQQSPWSDLQSYASVVGQPGYGQSSTQQSRGDTESNIFGNILGGGMAGYGLLNNTNLLGDNSGLWGAALGAAAGGLFG